MKLALRHQWLFARIELGLSRVEFNTLTPADFKVAIKLWEEKQKRERKRQDELVGRLAMFVNHSVVPRKPGDKYPDVTDFMPSPSKKAKRLSGKELQSKTEQMLGGK